MLFGQDLAEEILQAVQHLALVADNCLHMVAVDMDGNRILLRLDRNPGGEPHQIEEDQQFGPDRIADLLADLHHRLRHRGTLFQLFFFKRFRLGLFFCNLAGRFFRRRFRLPGPGRLVSLRQFRLRQAQPFRGQGCQRRFPGCLLFPGRCILLDRHPQPHLLPAEPENPQRPGIQDLDIQVFLGDVQGPAGVLNRLGNVIPLKFYFLWFHNQRSSARCRSGCKPLSP